MKNYTVDIEISINTPNMESRNNKVIKNQKHIL